MIIPASVAGRKHPSPAGMRERSFRSAGNDLEKLLGCARVVPRLEEGHTAGAGQQFGGEEGEGASGALGCTSRRWSWQTRPGDRGIHKITQSPACVPRGVTRKTRPSQRPVAWNLGEEGQGGVRAPRACGTPAGAGSA